MRRSLAAVVVLSIGAAGALRASADTAELTADFSGGGATETISAAAKSGAVRLEARGASGKRLARADAPAPAGSRPAVALAAGSIGSAGALLEVTASRDATVCRSIWRFRDGALSRLPLKDGAATLPDCETSSSWSTRWDESRNEPARYVRMSHRAVEQGRLDEMRVFAFVGFEMKHDPKKSSAEINGVPIPDWTPVTLYPKRELENLSARYALTGLARSARLRFEADREAGVFAVVLADPEEERRFPVSRSLPVAGEDPGLELTAGEEPIRVTAIPATGSAPQTAVVHGAGPRFDGGYAAVVHWTGERLEIYPTAEQEIASQFLPGGWVTERNERLLVAPIPGPAAVRFGDAEVVLRLRGAPEGTDLLLVPKEGGTPSWALTLRGASGFRRVPLQCQGAPGETPICRAAAEGDVFRRVGSQINVR